MYCQCYLHYYCTIFFSLFVHLFWLYKCGKLLFLTIFSEEYFSFGSYKCIIMDNYDYYETEINTS